MSKPVDRATVASMKKAVVRYKRSNLNQSKMRKPQLQSTLRALGVQSVPTVATRKRTKKAPPKRNNTQRLGPRPLPRPLLDMDYPDLFRCAEPSNAGRATSNNKVIRVVRAWDLTKLLKSHGCCLLPRKNSNDPSEFDPCASTSTPPPPSSSNPRSH